MKKNLIKKQVSKKQTMATLNSSQLKKVFGGQTKKGPEAIGSGKEFMKK